MKALTKHRVKGPNEVVDGLWGTNFFLCHQVVDTALATVANYDPDYDALTTSIKNKMKDLAGKSATFLALLNYFGQDNRKVYMAPLKEDFLDYGFLPAFVTAYNNNKCTFSAVGALTKANIGTMHADHPRDAVLVIHEKLKEFDDKIEEVKWEARNNKPEKCLWGEKNKKIATPAEIAIAHELIHTYHFFQGCLLAYNSKNAPDKLNVLAGAPFNYKADQISSIINVGHYASTEEWVTVGADSAYVEGNNYAAADGLDQAGCTLPLAVTENKIRTEAGLPYRGQYVN
jgi:hypothetical protein